MKKFLHVIMFVLLSMTALQITSVQAANDRPKVDYGSVEFGKELSVSADQDGLDGSITVTVPKDGFYSVRVKPESTQYHTVSGGIYKNNEEVTPYAEDFRTSDNTKLRYYELKKGEEVIVKLGARSTARARVIVDTVEEVKPGQKMSFEGEFDKTYYAHTWDSISDFKFGCLIPKDDDGNNLLNIRVRDFQEPLVDDMEEFLARKDVSVNTVLGVVNGSDKPHFFNVYAYKNSNSIGNASKARSDVQFIEMEKLWNDAEIKVNMLDDPMTFVAGQNCWKETDENGESYNRYYYSIASFIKSYTVSFIDGEKEFPVNASAREEKDPYSPYTGYYLTSWDDQKTNHWTAGGDKNYFYVKLAYKTIKIPVEVKRMEDIPQLKLYGNTSFGLMPNKPLRKSVAFTPEETSSNHSLFVYLDRHLESCSDFIGIEIKDEEGNYVFTRDSNSCITSKLDDGRNQYELKIARELEKGKKYIIDCYFVHKDNDQTDTDTLINLSLSMKDPVPFQSFKIKNQIRPDLIEGIDNVSGVYKYSLSDSIDQLDVTYSDDTVVPYVYDSSQNTFVPKEKVDPKYTVYPFTIVDEQEQYPWNEEGYHSISIKAKYTDNDKRFWSGCSFTFNVVSQERFQKYYLSEMETDQEYVFGTVSTEQYLANGSYSKYYQFIPKTSGKYNFETSVTKHDDQCNVTAEYIIYQDGREVSSGQGLEVGKEYIVKFYGRHNNACQNTDLTSLKPAIKVTKAISDQEPTTATTEVTTVTTTATTEVTTVTTATATEKVTTETPATTTTATATEKPETKPEKPETKPDTPSSEDTLDKPSDSPMNQPVSSSKKDNTTKPATPTIQQTKGSKIKKVKAAKKALTITWTKVKDIKGYEIWLATDKKFTKNRKIVLVGNPKTTKKTVKKLKAKKKYYVRIRTYKKVGFKKVYSKWMNVKSAKTK